MKKIKAVVLETLGSQCVVLADDGSFRTLLNQYGAQVGEEIEFIADADRGGLNSINVKKGIMAWKAWVAVAALLLLTLTVTLGWNVAQASTAVALVSLDINPSIELTVNAREQVLTVRATNADGEKILQSLELKNKPIPEAVSKILDQAVGMGYLTDEHSWVLVGLAPSGEGQLPPALEEAVKSAGAAVQAKVKAKIAVLQLTDQERAQAEQTGVSIGEYALWQSADKAGIKVEAKELKTKTERVRLLEAPEIQAQVLKDKGVLEIPGAEGKDSAIENMLERKKDNNNNNDINNDINNDKDKNEDTQNQNLNPGQERTPEGSLFNRVPASPDKSGKQDFQVTVPLKSDEEASAKPQANEIERSKEDAGDGDQGRESGKTSDKESERERH